MPFVRAQDNFYGEITAEVIRDDWKRRKEKYPTIYTGKNLAKWMNLAERTISQRFTNKVVWNVTFDDFCKYADAVGTDRNVLIQMIDHVYEENDSMYFNSAGYFDGVFQQVQKCRR